MTENGDIILTTWNRTSVQKLEKSVLKREKAIEWDVSWDGKFILLKTANNYILRDIQNGDSGISEKLDATKTVSWAEFGLVRFIKNLLQY